MAAYETANDWALAQRTRALALLVHHFRQGLTASVAAADVAALLIATATELGFDYVAMAEHGDLTNPSRPLLLVSNYPALWQRQFAEQRLDRLDPIQLACWMRTAGFRWNAVAGNGALSPQQLAVLRSSRRHGLHDGYTVPLHLPGARAASCSFAVRRGSSFPVDALLAAETIAREAYDRLQLVSRAGTARSPLSSRQVQCVALLAAGLTDRGIARTLALSEETVTKYLNAARRRYGLARRAQLVAVALRDGVIGFDDIDPR